MKFLSGKDEIDELNWMTDKVLYYDLPQITDNYVVHARGFVINRDVWLDPFSLRMSHGRLWRYCICPHYGYEWGMNPFDWEQYDDIDGLVYFSITGSGSFLVPHPRMVNVNSMDVGLLDALLRDLEVPNNLSIYWTVDDPKDPENVTTQKITASRIFES